MLSITLLALALFGPGSAKFLFARDTPFNWANVSLLPCSRFRSADDRGRLLRPVISPGIFVMIHSSVHD